MVYCLVWVAQRLEFPVPYYELMCSKLLSPFYCKKENASGYKLKYNNPETGTSAKTFNRG